MVKSGATIFILLCYSKKGKKDPFPLFVIIDPSKFIMAMRFVARARHRLVFLPAIVGRPRAGLEVSVSRIALCGFRLGPHVLQYLNSSSATIALVLWAKDLTMQFTFNQAGIDLIRDLLKHSIMELSTTKNFPRLQLLLRHRCRHCLCHKWE